jgi:uncharacterized protein YbaP (TraB family)
MRKITKKTGIFLIIFSMFLSISAGGCKESKEEKKYGDTKGLFWEVKKGSATVYILGTEHVGEKDLFPMVQVVEDAFDSSNIVVAEVNATNTLEFVLAEPLMEYPKGETAMDHLSSAGKDKLEKLCKELGIDSKSLLNKKIWAIGSALSGALFQKAGYDAANGVEMHYLNKAKASGKAIQELESVKFQYDILNSFSDKEQEDSLLLNLGTIEESKKNFDDLINAYKSGDEEKLKEMIFPYKNSFTADKNSNVYNKLVLERNKGMTNKLVEYLNTSNTYFVTAGSGHFLGDDSVIKMLRDKGYTVVKK